MSEVPRNHQSAKEKQTDPAAGENLLPAQAERTPAMARQEAAIRHQAAAEKQHKLAEAAAIIESTTSGQINPLERLRAEEKAETDSYHRASPKTIDSELKKITLQRELKQVRRQLPVRQRVLSRAVHLPLIRSASEAAAQSISRPSGLFGGGLVAFFGSLGYLYLTKHDNIHYNYFVFLALFIGGFAIGLLLEFIVYLMTRPVRRHHD